MRAGSLNEVITIERQTWSQNQTFGDQKTEVWNPVIKTRASVSYKDGMRMDDNNELFFSQQQIFMIRIYHDVQNLDRIVWKNRRYRILNIQEDRNVMRLIISTELIND